MGRRAKSTTEKTLDFLKKLGADTSAIEGVLENVREYKDLNFVQEQLYWQSNSNTTFLKKWSRSALFKNCDQCGKEFATNYHGVAYCSSSCGAKAFMAMTKMPWEYTRKAYSRPLEDKWKEYEPPMVVDPDFLATLEFIYEKLKELRETSQTKEYQNLPDQPPEDILDVFDFFAQTDDTIVEGQDEFDLEDFSFL